MTLAPVVLFTYNRLTHTVQTIDALKKNIYAEQSELIIFSDGPKTELETDLVREVRSYLKTIEGFRSVEIVEREVNFGLANNIIDGVSSVLTRYESIIVLEDDLITSPFFLKFVNEALELYANQKNVLSIHGYVYPVASPLPSTFFLIDPGSLGWGTWRDRWKNYEKDGRKLLGELKAKKLQKEFNYDDTYPFLKILEYQVLGKNSSWVIRWYAQALLNRQFTLYPGRSLVYHNGSDGSGTHAGNSDIFDVALSTEPVPVCPIEVALNKEARDAFKAYFKKINPGLVRKAVRKIKKLLHD